MTPTSSRPAPPPSARRPAPPSATPTNNASGNATAASRFGITTGRVSRSPQRVLLYGPAGIGKSSLAALAPEPVFLDLERGTHELDVPRIEGIETFADLRAVLQSDLLAPYKTVVLDSITRAEELAVAHVIQTVKNEKGECVDTIEGFSYGRGLQHVYDAFLLLLQDLDLQVRSGRNVVLIAHDCTTDVPNPAGENFLRFEPHLQASKSGKASVRLRVIQYADHVLFMAYDVAVLKGGKGKGGGTRTIWTVERPDHIAKSRSLSEVIPFESSTDGTIWTMLLNAGGEQ